MESPPGAEPEIEVGAADDTYRLWRSKEAVRHGELRLNAQTTNRTGLEGRATAIIGWTVPVALAALAIVLNPQIGWATTPAIAVIVTVVLAAAMASAALWPRNWNVGGIPWDGELWTGAASELEAQERIAAHYLDGIEANSQQLRTIGWLVRLAWIAFSVTPVVGAIAAVLL